MSDDMDVLQPELGPELGPELVFGDLTYSFGSENFGAFPASEGTRQSRLPVALVKEEEEEEEEEEEARAVSPATYVWQDPAIVQQTVRAAEVSGAEAPVDALEQLRLFQQGQQPRGSSSHVAVAPAPAPAVLRGGHGSHGAPLLDPVRDSWRNLPDDQV